MWNPHYDPRDFKSQLQYHELRTQQLREGKPKGRDRKAAKWPLLLLLIPAGLLVYILCQLVQAF